MTSPLGGKRRERKRLKRCAHRNVVSFVEASSIDDVLACRDCGSSRRIARTLMLTRELAPLDLRTEFSLPDRIARKAADA